MAERYQAGETLHAIAADLSVDRALLAKLLRERGVDVRYRLADEASVSEAAELYASGQSLKRVGEQFGISARAVLDAFRRAGVEVRPSRRGC